MGLGSQASSLTSVIMLRARLQRVPQEHMETVMQVTVVESHAIPGGAAHAWVQNGYHFESGPSLYSGMAAKCGPHLITICTLLRDCLPGHLSVCTRCVHSFIHLPRAPRSHTGPWEWKVLALPQQKISSSAHIAAAQLRRRGRRGRGANPIAHVLQAIQEPLDLIEYNRWNVILPEGEFLTEVLPELCLPACLVPPW